MNSSVQTVQIVGEVINVLYSDRNTGFTVADIQPQDSDSKPLPSITIVGNIESPTPGEILRVDGTWDNHPQFGNQLKVVKYKTELPITILGLKNFLLSPLFKGIGKATVNKIVDKFGLETSKILNEEPHRLAEVPGIPKKRIEVLKDTWANHFFLNETMSFLQAFVSSTLAKKIYNVYGLQSEQIIRENPYRLATEIVGIGFPTADRIAAKLGVPSHSPQRISSGVLHVLSEVITSQGHVCCPRSVLVKEAKKILDVDNTYICNIIDTLASDNEIIVDDSDPHAIYIYLPSLYYCEKESARLIKKLVNHSRDIHTLDMETADEWIRNDLSITANEEQRIAACNALKHKAMVLTGGPGTGKTTTVNAIIRLYEETRAKILLAAPTGRAAKRMSETTGYEASTIHRLLEYNPAEGGFMRCHSNPLSCDLLIIDETSMMDIVLTYHLLDALPSSATVIFVGDSDQLPSVGPGNVLSDIINSGIVPVYHLTQIHRQSQESSIVVNAHRINNGQMPICLKHIDVKNRDFFVLEEDNPEVAAQTIKSLITERLPKAYGFNPFSDIQVLSPMYKGHAGVNNLNKVIQESLSPTSKSNEMKRGETTFREGDRVIQLKNNYDKNVFNGDVGTIKHIDTINKKLVVNFDNKNVEYDCANGFSDLDELMLAYAVSIHKSQGSEYPAVIVSLQNEHYMLLQRNLLYTAVTRGKRIVVLVGSKKAIATAINNTKKQIRYTRLCEHLGGRKDHEQSS